MFETRSPRNFNSAPQSITACIATVLKPAITVLVYLGALAWHGESVGRADLTLCLLVLMLALTFQGMHRFRDRLSCVAVGILGPWLALLAILLGLGYGTRSLDRFDPDVVLLWAVITPLIQLAAVRLGCGTIHRTSLDELPQFISVLQGCMRMRWPAAARRGAQRDPYKRRDIDLTGSWGPSGRTKLCARISDTSTDHADSRQHDFSALTAGIDHIRRSFEGTRFAITGADRTTSLTLGARWLPTRATRVGCDLGHDNRSLSQVGNPHDSNPVSGYGQFVLQ